MLHSAIIEAAGKGVDWEHVHALVQTLGQEGMIDPAGAWDESGRTLLGALMRARSGYDGVVPETLVALVMSMDPQALTRQDPGENTAVDYFLDAFKEDNKNHARWLNARWWFTHAPKAQLLNWVPKNHYGETVDPEPNGFHLVNAVLDIEGEREYRATDHTLLTDLARLGVDMNVRNRTGYHPGNKIKHDIQWEAYLAHGGDPFAMVNNDAQEKPPVPLWRYLVDRSYETASKAAQAWAKEHVGDTMKQKLYEDYWAKLAEKQKYGTSPTNIPALVRSHDDYLSLRDPEGRTVAMYIISMHGSAYKTLQQKQYQQMNKERDAHGYSLWHYALSNGKKVGQDALRFLLESQAPMDPNPKTGRGLFPTLLIDFPHKNGIYERYPREVKGLDSILKKTTGEQWWAMGDGDWELMQDSLNEVLKNADARLGLVYIACQFIEHIPDAQMREKLMQLNLDGYGDRINSQGVVKYFELGYADQWEESQVERLKNKLGADAFSQVQSTYQARRLDQAAPEANQARKGPRL